MVTETRNPPYDKMRTNLFFLKAHKCGSSTVQNIIMRFGYKRGLTYALPSKNNYLGNPIPFKADMVGPELRSPDGKYNFLTHHSRLSEAGVREVMYPDALWVTVIRDPADLFESLYSYYSLERLWDTTLGELAAGLWFNKTTKRAWGGRLGVNQMSWDMGLDVALFNDRSAIDSFIANLERMFDLVMVSEYMEASLVMLADLMNWPLEEVVFLKLNARPTERVLHLNPQQRNMLHQLNSADHVLYKHFLKAFKERARRFGVARLLNSVERLLTLNRELYMTCVAHNTLAGFLHTLAYQVNSSNPACKYAAMGELSFTEELRNKQRERLRTLDKLHKLLS